MKRLASFLTALILLFTAVLLVKLNAQTAALGPNLVANPSFVTASSTAGMPANWSKDKWGSETSTLTYKTTDGRTDKTSGYVSMTKHTSGDAKWHFDDVNVKPSTNYTFSDYYKSNITTSYVIEYISTSGVYSYVNLTTTAASSVWKQKTMTFTTPANVKQASVLHLVNKVGWLQTDDYNMAETNPPVVVAPSVTISSPTNGSTVSKSVIITANPNGGSGTVAGVQFKIDGVNFGSEVTTSPYSVAWDSTTATNGSHTIMATVRNSLGATASTTSTVTISNVVTPPSVSLTSPANNSTLSGTVNVVASADGGSGTVAGVQFKIGSTNLGAEVAAAPYSTTWDTTTVADGTYTVSAVVRNSLGTTATSSVSVTVKNVIVTPPPTATNLVPNPSLEDTDPNNSSMPASWFANAWGTNTPVFTYPVAGNNSTKAVRIDMNSYTSGDAKWYFNPVTVKPGTTYNFSDTSRSNVATTLVIAELDASGNYTYSGYVNVPASSTWQTANYSFTTAATTKTLTVFHLINSVGWLELDLVNLSEGTTVTPPPVDTSTIPNGSVETANAAGTAPTNWTSNAWGTNTTTFQYMNEGHTGSHSVRTTISSYSSGDAKWYFNPITTLTPGNTYSFSAWYKSTTQMHVVAAFDMTNGTTVYSTLPMPHGPSTTWQQYNTTFDVPAGTKDTTIYMLIQSVGYVETDDYTIAPYTPVGFSEGLVSLTFDDDWANIYDNGLPLLNKYGLPSTQYVISGTIGTPQYMMQAQVQAFLDRGDEIGGHTITHPDLTTLTSAQLTNELQGGQSALRSLFGSSVATDFASPYGAYNDNVIANIKLYYRSHRSTDEGFNSKDNFDIYNIKVQDIDINTTPAEVEAWVDQAKAQHTWLVLVYHQVENTFVTGDDYAVLTSNLDTELSYIKNSGITVKTMSGALDEVTAQL